MGKRAGRVKVPTVLQMEAVECGAASLAMILAYFGKWVPLPNLRRDCGVSRDGSKASNILRAARRYGLVAKGFKKDMAGVRTVAFPAIVFWNFNHFVVLEGFDDEHAHINDPEGGQRKVTLQEFDDSFTGVVLVFEPGEDFEQGGSRPSVVKALAQIVVGSRRGLVFCILAGLLLVAPGLVLPVLTQLFIDEVLIQGHLEMVRVVLLAMTGTIVVQMALAYLQMTHLRMLRLKLGIGLSSRFLWHILRLPVGYFAQRYTGEVVGRTYLTDKIAEVLSGRLATVAIECVMVVFYAGLMLYYDPLLTAIGVGFALFNVFVLRWISSHRETANRRMLQEEGKLVGVGMAGLQGIETIKASASEGSFFLRWSGHHATAMMARQTMAVTDGKLAAVPVLLTAISSALVLVVGATRVVDGALTVGMLIAFRSLMGSLQGPVHSLVDMGSVLQELSGDLERLTDVFEYEEDAGLAERGEEADLEPGERLEGHVELKGVTFGYSPVEKPLIDGFDLKLSPGQRVALVGASGSGKSTVAKLVSGLYQPWSGQVMIDGLALTDIPRATLAPGVGVVDQDLVFFAGTVRENLTLWDPKVPPAELERACRDAEMHDVILALPGGYDAELGEGAHKLSGGQRQRLEIARTLATNPSVLVLDEATSALDTETERKIDRNLRRRGCTCVIVAHRLSTIRDCDEIIVMSAGKVVERGTYTELQAQQGALMELLREAGEGGGLDDVA